MREVQFIELCLTRTVVIYRIVCSIRLFCPIDKEIIQGAMTHKLQGTPRVSHTFPVITLSMCKVIHRVSIPLVASTPMWHVQHTIKDGVTEVHVRACHVYLGTQHHLTWLQVAGVHLLEQTQALLHRTVTIRRICAWLSGCALLFSYLLGCLLVNVCPSVFYHPNSKVP